MFNEEFRLDRPIRWAMVGGGRGSQIGYIHRSSAKRDGLLQLVAGAFDINHERCIDFGKHLELDTTRCYKDYITLFEEEAKREDGIEAVSIATPNNTHFEICKAALEHNLHVICEKPLCFTSEQGDELQKLSKEKNKVLAVTYGYTGHQMIHQGREMIKNGDIGEVRIINMQFAHGFHSEEVELNDPGTKWRVSPAVAGDTYVLGDIGTHALFLAEAMIPDISIKDLMCFRQSFVKSRAPLEDNAVVLMNFTSGAVGNLWCSAVNAGGMHQQKIRVVGSKASIEWWDEQPNQLRYEIQGEPVRILERGMGYLYREDDGVRSDRIGAGHSEGLFDSWSNLYHRFAKAMDLLNQGKEVDFWYPNVEHGTHGTKFLEKCVKSADNGGTWVDFE